MDFSVDKCRRRPDCRRLLIYLDTSTYRRLARGEEGADDLRAVLTTSLEDEAAICAGSPWLDDEAALLRPGPTLDGLVGTVRRCTLDLRMKFEEEIIDFELSAAAREFSGERVQITWEEAFRDDPDDPPLAPFQASYLNERDRFENRPAGLGHSIYDRGTSESLTEAHTKLREAGLAWEKVALANLERQVRYLLFPLEDAKSVERALNLEQGMDEEVIAGRLTMDPGSAGNKFLRLAHVVYNAKRLRERFPAVGTDPVGFSKSDSVIHLPTIRLFSFLLAALSVDGRRTKPQKSDLHDLRHLTYGLSRCDIVTADKRSCELVRGRNLAPPGVSLSEAHRLPELAELIDQRLSDR